MQSSIQYSALFLMTLLLVLLGLQLNGQESKTKAASIYKMTVKTSEGQDRDLSEYRNRTVLIVNTASRCGLTPQYRELQSLYERYQGRGFVVLAFPANNFRDQEPGSDEEIRRFCTEEYGVSFPLFAKLSVSGDDIHPLYALLTDSQAFPESGGPIRWNFDKFLVSPGGETVIRFEPKTQPLSSDLTQAIEAMLKTTTEPKEVKTIAPPCCR